MQKFVIYFAVISPAHRSQDNGMVQQFEQNRRILESEIKLTK